MRLEVIVLILAMVLLVSCTSQTINPQKICQSDLDCVPAECCHATNVVNKDNAPDCSGKICTLDCAPGTLDCGQGSISCVQSVCVVMLDDQ